MNSHVHTAISVVLYAIAAALAVLFGLHWWQAAIVIIIGAAAGTYATFGNARVGRWR